MSHYSVCVTVPHHYDGTQVDAEVIESCLDKILAPFDEQTDEESYCEFEDRTAEAKSDSKRKQRKPFVIRMEAYV